MYAVIFDIDTDCPREQFENLGIPNDINEKIKKFMTNNGFAWKQGSVYFGDETINAVSCVTTVQRLAKEVPALSTCVKDIKMLKIEECSDLLPAIQI